MPCRKGRKKHHRRRRIRTSGIYKSRDGTGIVSQLPQSKKLTRLKRHQKAPGLDEDKKADIDIKVFNASMARKGLEKSVKKIDELFAMSLAYSLPFEGFSTIPDGYKNDIESDIGQRIDSRTEVLTVLTNKLIDPTTTRIDPLDPRFAILQCNLLEMWYCQMLHNSPSSRLSRAETELGEFSDDEEEGGYDDFVDTDGFGGEGG